MKRRDKRNKVFFVRVTDEEHEALLRAAVNAGELPGIWARNVLLRAAGFTFFGSGPDQGPVERGARSPLPLPSKLASAGKGKR